MIARNGPASKEEEGGRESASEGVQRSSVVGSGALCYSLPPGAPWCPLVPPRNKAQNGLVPKGKNGGGKEEGIRIVEHTLHSRHQGGIMRVKEWRWSKIVPSHSPINVASNRIEGRPDVY